MIDLGRPALHAESVTVFCDHANPNSFYYLPDAPRLRRSSEGKAELSLLKYRLDPALNKALGAGLLSLTVDLGVEQAQLDRVRRRIARQFELNSQITLSPVSADSGTCQLILIDQKSETATGVASAGFGMVERILGSASPSLYGDNATTFEAVLSPEGVGLVEGALLGGGLPAGVVYTLQVTGLRPAIRAKITARWSDIYDYYDNRLHGGKLLLAMDIGATLEDLAHSEAIKVEVDELIPETNRLGVYHAALDQMERYVLNQFFKPTLGQQPPKSDDPDGPLQTIGKAIKDVAGVFAITYTLRDVKREELKTFTYQLSAAQAEVITLSPQGTFGIILGAVAGEIASKYVIEVEPAASSEMAFDIGSAIDLAAEKIDHVQVSLTYGDHRQDVLLDAATPRRQATFWYEPALGPEIRFEYEIDFAADSAGQATRLISDSSSTADRVIRLNPRELYQRASLRVVAKGIPFDRYPSAIVDLKATDPVGGRSTSDTVELSAAHPEATFDFRTELGAHLLFERRVRYLDPHGTEILLDWDSAEAGVLVVADPLPAILDLEILGSARFGASIRRLIVELRPRSSPAQVTTFVLTGDQPSATWSRAMSAGSDRDYEYRVTLFTMNNEVKAGTWLAGTPDKLIVGEGIARVRPVEMIFVGPTLAALKWLGLKVRFAFEDGASGLSAEDEVLVQDTSHSVKWAYPVADAARQEYSYQVTSIGEDGATRDGEVVRTSSLLIIRKLPF